MWSWPFLQDDTDLTSLAQQAAVLQTVTAIPTQLSEDAKVIHQLM